MHSWCCHWMEVSYHPKGNSPPEPQIQCGCWGEDKKFCPCQEWDCVTLVDQPLAKSLFVIPDLTQNRESCAIAKVRSIRNKRKPCNATGKPAAYSAIPLVPSISSIQSVPEELRIKLCSEPLLKYPHSFYGLKPCVQVTQETRRWNEKKTWPDVTENAQLMQLYVCSHTAGPYLVCCWTIQCNRDIMRISKSQTLDAHCSY
jgi:hypothetical protein